MKKKLTPEETQELFVFCHKHYVYHYDMQVELVDHLASSIEEQWEKEPEISFEKALNNTFGKFGIYGFSKIKEQKQKELAKNYNRLLWQYFIAFFKWPKILITAAFTLLLATLIRLVENVSWVIIPYFVLLLIFVIYYYYFIYPKRFKFSKINGKKFLVLEQLKRIQVTAFLFVQIPIQISNILQLNKTELDNIFIIFSISLATVLLTVALIGELFYVPEKIKIHFSKQFPEFAV